MNPSEKREALLRENMVGEIVDLYVTGSTKKHGTIKDLGVSVVYLETHGPTVIEVEYADILEVKWIEQVQHELNLNDRNASQ